MMHARKESTFVVAALIFLVGGVLSFGALAQAGANPDLPNLTAKNRGAVAQEIEPELQAFVDGQKRIAGQAKQVLVKVTPDAETGVVWIDLDASYLPRGASEFTEDFGELVREVENEGYELLGNVVRFNYIKVRIGGKELREIYPPAYLKKQRAAALENQAVAAPVAGLVVLNPGHGKYLHHADETWRYQRPTPYAGTTNVYEDTVTPGYSSRLASYLADRSASTVTSVKHTRDITNTTQDPASGLSWAALGSRYYLKRIYPELGATIWNKFPNGSPSRKQPERSNLREYDDDIRSRPEYANYINAETMISLHTDAAGATARGATVVTNLSDPASTQLANNIHCYLKEQITQLPDYASYPIRVGVRSGDSYGEVREAAMATALVEVGFHSNSEDSALLRNSSFRAAAMRGVEKGYRMYKEGKSCAPFSVASVGPASGPKGTKVPVYFTYTGEPRGGIEGERRNRAVCRRLYLPWNKGSYGFARRRQAVLDVRLWFRWPK
ncbi:N-acetylmuramoyl-L-alanine amidase family protein [Pseudoxanthomonas composti]|uniref:N-acetylmuramoyl-L-alanine amidase n=1 Tax=Pseudoxanthomonas composti TaxID=2137479 RepID=A0A4Q1JSU4_9GAMM|nr:N-acetylmuramoyl-L-alanine amidase [Pseudoxanthomonas composti]RXR00315.1 N-acetylmuramoyl-L-alanine amidase [Pseudoxanthomonas composti]